MTSLQPSRDYDEAVRLDLNRGSFFSKQYLYPNVDKSCNASGQ